MTRFPSSSKAYSQELVFFECYLQNSVHALITIWLWLYIIYNVIYHVYFIYNYISYIFTFSGFCFKGSSLETGKFRLLSLIFRLSQNPGFLSFPSAECHSTNTFFEMPNPRFSGSINLPWAWWHRTLFINQSVNSMWSPSSGLIMHCLSLTVSMTPWPSTCHNVLFACFLLYCLLKFI